MWMDLETAHKNLRRRRPGLIPRKQNQREVDVQPESRELRSQGFQCLRHLGLITLRLWCPLFESGFLAERAGAD